jgi:hypothetical protein
MQNDLKYGQMILTVAESKRLLCKAILAHPYVQKAWEDGITVIHPSSTTYFVLKELGLELPKESNGLWVCGHISPKGLCQAKPMADLMLGSYKDPGKGTLYPFDFVFKKGVLQSQGPLQEALDEMNENDVYVKSVNAIDPEGKLGILLCVPGGGSIGNVLRNKTKRKYKILCATGLEKSIPVPIKNAAKLCASLDRATGIKCKMTILRPDDFISEIEAFKALTGCDATPIACGGIDGMEGGYVFVLAGTQQQLDRAWGIWEEIRGSAFPDPPEYECSECPFPVCEHSPSYDINYSEGIYRAPVVK